MAESRYVLFDVILERLRAEETTKIKDIPPMCLKCNIAYSTCTQDIGSSSCSYARIETTSDAANGIFFAAFLLATRAMLDTRVLLLLLFSIGDID